jgi:hypothetical protein
LIEFIAAFAVFFYAAQLPLADDGSHGLYPERPQLSLGVDME